MGNWTEQQLAAHRQRLIEAGINPDRAFRVPLTYKKAPRSEMNKGETRYAQWLDLQQKVGDVKRWYFQALTFKLAKDCRYTPDFLVFRGDAQICVDVKGLKRKPDGTQTYWATEDSRIKIKVSAKMFPMYKWVIAFPLQNGNWEEREM